MFKTKYIYVPFNDPQLIGWANELAKNWHAGKLGADKFARPVLSPSATGEPLRKVSASTQLYIFGHGGDSRDYISSEAGERLTMGELAAQLIDNGLSRSHKKIKLFCCKGGSGGVNSMAARLKRELQVRRVVGVKVYGYTEEVAAYGTLESGSKYGYVMQADGSEKHVQAKKLRKAF